MGCCCPVWSLAVDCWWWRRGGWWWCSSCCESPSDSSRAAHSRRWGGEGDGVSAALTSPTVVPHLLWGEGVGCVETFWGLELHQTVWESGSSQLWNVSSKVGRQCSQHLQSSPGPNSSHTDVNPEGPCCLYWEHSGFSPVCSRRWSWDKVTSNPSPASTLTTIWWHEVFNSPTKDWGLVDLASKSVSALNFLCAVLCTLCEFMVALQSRTNHFAFFGYLSAVPG